MEQILPIVGEKADIQAYKHDGSLHRTWRNSYVIEASEDRIVCVTDKTLVIEADGRRWQTREPAIYFLYARKWFNIIAMMRKNGVYYYCNIATPFVSDKEAIKNIDYDLDVKVWPDMSYQILDENEYELHRKKMGYSDTLDRVLHQSMDSLIEMIKRKEEPFDHELIDKYYQRYIILRSDKE